MNFTHRQVWWIFKHVRITCSPHIFPLLISGARKAYRFVPTEAFFRMALIDFWKPPPKKRVKLSFLEDEDDEDGQDSRTVNLQELNNYRALPQLSHGEDPLKL